MKKYRISYHENGVQKSHTIYAKDRDDALKKAWSMVDADDVYVSEVDGT